MMRIYLCISFLFFVAFGTQAQEDFSKNTVVEAKYDIIDENGAPRNMWNTLIVVMTTEGWKIAAIRNMLLSQ